MQNKIIVETGRTILKGQTKNDIPNVKKINGSMLDEMQSVYEKVESGYNFQTSQSNILNTNNTQNQQMQNNNMFNGFNASSLASILPLLKNMGGKNTNGLINTLNMLPNIQNNGSNMSLISQLLPLLQNMNNKSSIASDSQIKIDSLTKADE